MNSFPDLPIVARHILEIAAMHDRQSVHNLVYVSKADRSHPISYCRSRRGRRPAPPFHQILESGIATANDEGLDEDYVRSPGRLGQAEGFDIAAANLINALSDRRFVFVIPNNCFVYISGLVSYEHPHDPLLDWAIGSLGNWMLRKPQIVTLAQ
ncbi:hypothetical protein CPB85DRAFT_484515 [Mucidula mucida]|nr:hypothetical protein CPB85DRAFT_484515 [Mucidula mucida]